MQHSCTQVSSYTAMAPLVRRFTQAELKLERLLGDAAHGPVVFDEDQITMSIGLACQLQ